MTSVTLASYPSPKLVAAEIGIYTLDTQAPYLWDVIGYVVSQFPYLDSRGVSGYSFISDNYTIPDGNNGSITAAGIAGEFMILDTQDVNDMQSIWAPITEHINKTWPGVSAQIDAQPFASFLDWFSLYYDQFTTGVDAYVGSRLLDADSLANSTAVGEAFRLSRPSPYLVAGQGVKNAKPRGGSNAVNPSWRRTIIHATNDFSFPPLNLTARAEALSAISEMTEPLRQLAPGMGAYVNEVCAVSLSLSSFSSFSSSFAFSFFFFQLL